MTKHCKVRIAKKAELGEGTGQYDILEEEDRADHDPEEGIPANKSCLVALALPQPLLLHVPPPSTNSSSLSHRSTLSPRKSKVHEKQNIFALMAMQMQNEAAQRACEACNQAATRAQMQAMIAGLATAYFGSVKSQKKEKGKKAAILSILFIFFLRIKEQNRKTAMNLTTANRWQRGWNDQLIEVILLDNG